MRRALALLSLLFVGSLAAADDWPGATFTAVRAYYYNAASEHDRRLLDRAGQFDATAVQPGVELNAAQTARLLALVRRGARPQPVTSCYVPHHGFVFTNALGRRVAVFEFCLECLKATPMPNTVGPFFDYPALADLLHELKLPIGPKFKNPAAYRRFHARRVKSG